jgi:hypothetical protein
MKFFLPGAALCGVLAMTGCGSSSSSSALPPASAGSVRVRFAEGAPELEAIINGVPQDIGAAYLQVDGATVSSQFNYGMMTPFVTMSAGTHSLRALNILGYQVGPIKTSALATGKRYTLILIGSYPTYRVLSFEEPANASTAQLSLYEASPAQPKADFGSFTASSSSNFKQLGSAMLGNVVTVSLGKSVSNIGGYAGKGSKTFGTVTPAQVNAYDKHDALPFHNATRLSLFLFDVKLGSALGPVIGSLDR